MTALLRGLADKGCWSCEASTEPADERRPASCPHRSSPLGLLAELTHRCPLGCPYCSNPLALDARDDELDTATWARVFREAAALGVLQVHLSGGEPAARRDLVDITAARPCRRPLHQSDHLGVGSHRALDALAEAGLDHVQISIQDSDARSADHIAGYDGALCAEARARGRGRAARAAAHRQRGHAPRQYRADRRHGRARARARREPGRDRACAILRLGAQEPRHADADARAGRACGGRGRGTAHAPSRPHRHRCRGAGLLRPLSQACVGGWGGARST